MAKKRGPGRPPKKKGEHQVNKPRMIGRWTDEDWETLQQASIAAGADNLTDWARAILMRAAKRQLGL